jgi:hypothetical protein
VSRNLLGDGMQIRIVIERIDAPVPRVCMSEAIPNHDYNHSQGLIEYTGAQKFINSGAKRSRDTSNFMESRIAASDHQNK